MELLVENAHWSELQACTTSLRSMLIWKKNKKCEIKQVRDRQTREKLKQHSWKKGTGGDEYHILWIRPRIRMRKRRWTDASNRPKFNAYNFC